LVVHLLILYSSLFSLPCSIKIERFHQQFLNEKKSSFHCHCEYPFYRQGEANFHCEGSFGGCGFVDLWIVDCGFVVNRGHPSRPDCARSAQRYADSPQDNFFLWHEHEPL
jgi:hypothetical protein